MHSARSDAKQRVFPRAFLNDLGAETILNSIAWHERENKMLFFIESIKKHKI